MIHEYALDPELLKAWAANDRDYHEFLREYGLGTSRLASSFPRQKLAKYRAFYLEKGPSDPQSIQAQRYLEMIQHLTEALVCRDGFECSSADWSENVLTEDARAPFYGLLSSTPLESPRCLTMATMYSPGSIWNNPQQKLVARTYESCSPLLRDMLRLSKDKIVFVDPYGWNQRAIEVISRLIGDAFNDRVHSAIPEVILCYKTKRDGGSPAARHVKSQLEQRIAHNLTGLPLRVYELEEISGRDVFHNRYLMTELGGVSLGHGVDFSEEDTHSDELTLLSREAYEQRWRQFVDRAGFTLVTQA